MAGTEASADIPRECWTCANYSHCMMSLGCDGTNWVHNTNVMVVHSTATKPTTHSTDGMEAAR